MFDLEIEIKGETHQAKVTPKIARKWEKQTGLGISHLDKIDNVGDLYLLAYLTAVHHKIFSGTLDEFENEADFATEVAEAPLASDKEASTET